MARSIWEIPYNWNWARWNWDPYLISTPSYHAKLEICAIEILLNMRLNRNFQNTKCLSFRKALVTSGIVIVEGSAKIGSPYRKSWVPMVGNSTQLKLKSLKWLTRLHVKLQHQGTQSWFLCSWRGNSITGVLRAMFMSAWFALWTHKLYKVWIQHARLNHGFERYLTILSLYTQVLDS